MNCPKCNKEMFDMGLWSWHNKNTLYHGYHCKSCDHYEKVDTNHTIVVEEDGTLRLVS